jgi:hypothetical protein
MEWNDMECDQVTRPSHTDAETARRERAVFRQVKEESAGTSSAFLYPEGLVTRFACARLGQEVPLKSARPDALI